MINSEYTEEDEEEYILADQSDQASSVATTTCSNNNIRRRRLWSIPSPSSGTSPSARWGHCSVMLKHPNINSNHPTLMIHGGFDGANMLNDVHLFDAVTNTWKQPVKTFGSTPSPRSGHSITVLSEEKGRLLFIGGGNGMHYLSDLVVMEIVTENDDEFKKEMQLLSTTNDSSIQCCNMFRWTRPKVSSRVRVYISDDDIILTEEEFHKLQEEIANNKNNSSGTVENEGEENKNPLVSSKVVEQFIRANQSGTKEDLIGFGNPSHHEQLDSLNFTMKEIYPAPRSRHTAVVTEDSSRVILYGGGGKNRIFDDIWVLDVNEMEWSQPSESENKPSARWGHSACVHSGKMYVFGGVFKTSMLNDLYMLDLTSFVWTRIELPDSGPFLAPRAAHTANIILGRHLLILWGGDDAKYFEDLFILDLQSHKARRIEFKSPKARCAHTTCLVDNNYLYVFGGGGGNHRFKELYLFDIKAAFEKVGIYETYGYESDDELLLSDTVEYSKGQYLSQYLDKLSQTYLELRSDVKIEGGPEEKQRSDTIGGTTKDLTAVSHLPNANESTDVTSTKTKTARRKRSSAKRKTLSTGNGDQMFGSKEVKEVTNWLVNLGLGRYASIFLQEEIDLECIPLLTDADLFKLGISKFGPRKKILAAAKLIPTSYMSPPNAHHSFVENSSSQSGMLANSSYQSSHQTNDSHGDVNTQHSTTSHQRSVSSSSITMLPVDPNIAAGSSSAYFTETANNIIQSVGNLTNTCEGIKDSLKLLSTNLSNLTLMLSNPYYGFRHPAAVAISMHHNQMQQRIPSNTNTNNSISNNSNSSSSNSSTSSSSNISYSNVNNPNSHLHHQQISTVPVSPRQTNFSMPYNLEYGMIPPPPPPTNISPVVVVGSGIPSRPRNVSGASNASNSSSSFKRNPLLPPVSTTQTIGESSNHIPAVARSSSLQNLERSTSGRENTTTSSSMNSNTTANGIESELIHANSNSNPSTGNNQTNAATKKKSRSRKPKKNGSSLSQQDQVNVADLSPEFTSYNAGESWFDITERDHESD
ncbi:hypothetical protein FDP41_008761 [Naegleria fowleri]|uniref:SAM domain-containing protein n=1 Tax=Naegleria fowleri TaxID=5763 RepID=A0A6A5BIP5_NAEFO|nr:uncharacterized protein FDP41_008761 [Naegleria fowleri]KAF0972909.1 hypothetical protein FDP41_008761 [Naegleria fowleri]CAG4714892.1 unnamed protein product [Naegleria fowleri]